MRWGSWVVVGLSQKCKTVSMGCGWSAAVVQEDFHGVWLVCCRSARGNPWRVISLLRRRCRLQGMVSLSTRERENPWDMESFDQA